MFKVWIVERKSFEWKFEKYKSNFQNSWLELGRLKFDKVKYSKFILILETEIRYNYAIQYIAHKEKKYSQLCGKIKQKEQNYEQKIQDINLQLEQDKFINKLIYEKPGPKPNRPKDN